MDYELSQAFSQALNLFVPVSSEQLLRPHSRACLLLTCHTLLHILCEFNNKSPGYGNCQAQAQVRSKSVPSRVYIAKTTKNFKNTIDIHKSLTKSPNLYNGGRNCECSQHISFTPVPDWGALSALCCTDQLTVIPLPLPLPQLPVHAPPTAPGACCAWVSIYCLNREMFLMLLFSSLGFRINLKLDSFH